MTPPEQPTLSEIKTEKEQAGVNQALLLVMGAVQEGHALAAGAGVVDAEGAVGKAVGHAVFNGPCHCVRQRETLHEVSRCFSAFSDSL